MAAVDLLVLVAVSIAILVFWLIVLIILGLREERPNEVVDDPILRLSSLLALGMVHLIESLPDTDVSEWGKWVESQKTARPTLEGLRGMESDRFEEYVADLYKRRGYEVELTEGGSDRGIDIIAEKKGSRIAIQAKCYREGNKVGGPVVRRVEGAARERGSDQAVIVTTSDFTKQARESAETLGIELIDGKGLVKMT